MVVEVVGYMACIICHGIGERLIIAIASTLGS